MGARWRQISISFLLGIIPAVILAIFLYSYDLIVEKIKKDLHESRLNSLKVLANSPENNPSKVFSLGFLPDGAASFSVQSLDWPPKLTPDLVRYFQKNLPSPNESGIQIDELGKEPYIIWIVKGNSGVWVALQSRRQFYAKIDTLKVLIWTGGLIVVGISFILFVYIARKISEIFSEMETKNLELERANRHLEELGKLKSNFLALVSHELRTPLARLNGQINLLLSGNEVPVDFKKRVLEMAVDIEELNRQTKNVLDLTRLQSEDLSVKSSPGQIGPIIESAVNRIKRAGKQRGLNFIFENVEIPLVNHDQYLLERILDNLLNNAVKYSNENSSVKISLHEKRDLIEIHVDSEGPVVPESEREKIFEKFYRGENSMENIPGTGLGLYLVRQFILIMGGRAWAVGSENGNRFVITLPLA
ncbi:MAG: hypothetical protein HQM08_14635 [Candidatus Riflebacteria bacterium]|nr:hypothetical protein [Candidatus Riflebacteria bacterium]